MESEPLQDGSEGNNGSGNPAEQTITNTVSLSVKISLLISLIFHVAMFGIGIWGIHKCTLEENIPFYLIVAGGIGFLSKSSTLIRPSITTYMNVANTKKHIQKLEAALYAIEAVFFIFGSFWVFKEYKPSFIPSEDPSIGYCDKLVYYFAFSYLIVSYSLLGIIIICYCCFLCCMSVASGVTRQQERNQDPEAPSNPVSTSDS
ncbi:hypothetical protein ABEB36_004076 [Hypothenemus hampei]|uniref:Uncharacterized protein n=1 Tax=Hypothenemus hampei TaxID=57062 RepID=A0ABD1F2F7_HYPHA